MKRFFLILVIAMLGVTAGPTARDHAIPRYAHIFVIMEENKNYGEVIGSKDAPALTSFAHTYGYATNYYAVTHPSEPNYVALVGGYTFGIRDDDALYCKPHDTREYCSNSNSPGYPDHTIQGPSLATQLEGAGLTWKNYNGSLPKPGSLAIVATDPRVKNIPSNVILYASKHSGFVNFASVQNDPHRAERIVGFDRLYADLKSGTVPAFSFIVPNLCDDMHGATEAEAPEDCTDDNKLEWRGDVVAKDLVHRIMSSPVWKTSQNSAIVITFDEDDWVRLAPSSRPGKIVLELNGSYIYKGCCGNDPKDPANRGGGNIPTIVIANHGPRGIIDSTPYSHYSLLRTIEDAFGIHEYLRRAKAPGVVPMVKLFATN